MIWLFLYLLSSPMTHNCEVHFVGSGLHRGRALPVVDTQRMTAANFFLLHLFYPFVIQW